MTRVAILFASTAIMIGGGVLIGLNWDRADELKDEIKALEEIRDATTDERTLDVIDERLRALAGD